jgi:hypothetical protein
MQAGSVLGATKAYQEGRCRATIVHPCLKIVRTQLVPSWLYV